ncbi:MAG TPA: DUF1289 domain-containing protein [Solimonas sp.]
MTEAVAPLEPPSPCVGVCTLDAQRSLCVGCGRSLREIAEWSSAGAERKRQIVQSAAQRRAQLPSPGAPR